MSESGDKVPEVYQGEAPTLLDAELANKLIGAVNALQNMVIKDGASNKVIYSDYGITLQIEQAKGGSTSVTTTGGGTEGYEEMNVALCENGSVTTRTILVKEV